MIAADYQMSDDMQAITFVMALGVVFVICLGIKAICADVTGSWSRDDAAEDAAEFADDFLWARDPHADDVRDAMQRWRG